MMQIPEKLKMYFCLIAKDQRKTLSDSQTKLYLYADQEFYCVTVDKGIIKNDIPQKKKCDFLVYSENKSQCHLIELKGERIEKAFDQLKETISNILADNEISFLLENLNILDAYIVSPIRQEIPNGIDEHKRALAKMLGKHSKEKPTNINCLIKFVRVIPNQKNSTEKNGHILCSNDAPLKF